MNGMKIKKEYEYTVIGFNNSSLPLGHRKDLHKFYEMAKAKNNQRWLDMFEKEPDAKKVEAEKVIEFETKQSKKKYKQP